MRVVVSKISGRFILFLVMAIILTNIPILGNYVKVINTLIHESGHAFIALLGGNVKRISLFMNTEGVTYSTQSTWIGGFFTSLAGYVFSSFMAFLSFWLIGKRQYRILIVVLLLFISLNLVFWVRNFYGLFWLISFGACFLILLFKGSTKLVNSVLLLIASILLVQSLTSAYEIMLISFIRPNSAGDAGNLAHLTVFIPVQVWGIFFFVQSIWFSIVGLRKGIFKLER
ncbi:MAG: M50 family metallopeptidase [Bacillota bacterium]|nr:M50 family metallopeptidase [Bacillota bacterium]